VAAFVLLNGAYVTANNGIVVKTAAKCFSDAMSIRKKTTGLYGLKNGS
jgi:hypothetical protein